MQSFGKQASHNFFNYTATFSDVLLKDPCNIMEHLLNRGNYVPNRCYERCQWLQNESIVAETTFFAVLPKRKKEDS